MEVAIAFHTAARKYCMDQYAFWTTKYAAFLSNDSSSEETYSIFPRYGLAEETLVNIERVVFSEDTTLETARETLHKAGTNAFKILADRLKISETAVLALRDQLSSYLTFLETFNRDSADTVECIPFRRVLAEKEATALWQVLADRWGILDAGHSWFPTSGETRPPGSLTFHTDLWDARQGNALFQSFLVSQGITRCFMLRELGPPDYEMDRELAEPAYDGSEAFLFIDTNWIIYASHESSLTLGGSIAAFFREHWHDADDLAYGGPFHTVDLRGHWNYTKVSEPL